MYAVLLNIYDKASYYPYGSFIHFNEIMLLSLEIENIQTNMPVAGGEWGYRYIVFGAAADSFGMMISCMCDICLIDWQISSNLH